MNKWTDFNAHSTKDRSLRRWVFPSNRLHWWWQSN